MKKYLIVLFVLLTTILCACSNNETPNTTPTSTEPTNNEYVIEDMMTETNVDELMKQNQNHTYYEGEDGCSYLSIPSSLGSIEGVYEYTITDGEVTGCTFQAEESFYTDPQIIWGYYDPEKLPAKDNEASVDAKVQELYRIITETYGLTEMSVMYEKSSSTGIATHPSISTYEEFRECIAPLYCVLESEYAVVVFDGFNEDSEFVSAKLVNGHFSVKFIVSIS